MERKRIAIMQPYFFPYVGYFHLLHAVDALVLYDNLQYTKKGWINRNRYLINGADALFTIPLQKASDFSNIDQRTVSEQFDRRKLLTQIRLAYQKSPFFESAMELLTQAIEYQDRNLFRFIKHSILLICEYLEIATPIIDSSTVAIDHSMRGQEKVLALCRELDASMYVNAIGGVSLYDQVSFETQGIRLRFVQSQLKSYRQFDHPFVPWLSILDVLMFNSRKVAQQYVREGYSLVTDPSVVP